MAHITPAGGPNATSVAPPAFGLTNSKMTPAGDGLTAIGTNTDAPNTAYVDPSYAVSVLQVGNTAAGSWAQGGSIAIHPTTGAMYVACRWVPAGTGFTGSDTTGKGVIYFARVDDGSGNVLPSASITWATFYTDATKDARQPYLQFLANGTLVMTIGRDTYNAGTGAITESGTGNLLIAACPAGADPTNFANWSTPSTVPCGFALFDKGSHVGFLEPDPAGNPGTIVVFIIGSDSNATYDNSAWVGTICTTVSRTGAFGAWTTPVRIAQGSALAGAPLIGEQTMALDSSGNWVMLIRDTTATKLWVTKRTAADVAAVGISGAATWSAPAVHLTTLFGGPHLVALSDGTMVLVARGSTTAPFNINGQMTTCAIGADPTNTANWSTPISVETRFQQTAWQYGQIREIPWLKGMFALIGCVINPTATGSEVTLRFGSATGWGRAPNGAVLAPAVYSEGDVRAGTGVVVGKTGLLITSGQVAGNANGPWTQTGFKINPGARAFSTSGGIVQGWRYDIVNNAGAGSVLYEPNFTPGFDVTTGFPSGAAGILAKTLEDVALADTDAAAALVSGVLLMCAVRLFAGQVYTSASAFIGATIGAPTNSWMTLHDKNGKILAISADKTNTVFTANTPRSYAFTAPYTAAVTSIGYIGLMVAGTVPSLISRVGNAAVLGSTDRGGVRVGTNNNGGTGFTTPPAVGTAEALTTGVQTAIPLLYLK